MSRNQYRVAAVQAVPVYMDAAATTAKSITLMEQAAGQGVALVAFGEAWLPGYPYWVWLDGTFANMPRFHAYQAASVTVPGPEVDTLCAAAARLGIHVVMGISERAGGTLYLSQIGIDDTGALLFTRRKLRPTLAERMVYGEGNGSDLCVVQTNLGRIGALCCWEHMNPLGKYAMYAQHEQVHIAAWPSFGLDASSPHALGSEVNNAISRVYAVEGQCYVIAPTSIIDDATLAAVADRAGHSAPFRAGGGCARIYAPDGRSLGTPLPETVEGLVVADVDLEYINMAKIAADPVGHYARPDVLRLWFNAAPAPCVENAEPAFADMQAERREPGY